MPGQQASRPTTKCGELPPCREECPCFIAAPSSTKNEGKTRDPEMHQTKKGKQWHFDMKAHIGVDAESGLVHTVIGTAAYSRNNGSIRRLEF